MKIRHKTPGFVSMWMLDVFCCALGCVTLLWLLKTREASIALDETRTVQNELAHTQLNLVERDAETLRLYADIETVKKQLALLKDEKDAGAKQLALVQREKDDQAKQLAQSREEMDAKAKKLALAEQTAVDTDAKLKSAADRLAELMKQATKRDEELAKRKDDFATLSRSAEEVKSRIADLERLNAHLQSDLKDSMAKGGSAEELKKKLEQATVQIIDLQGTKAKLADKLDKMRIESDAKFAGIAMTGKRVVFLVDMSGSMDRVDAETPSPQKWTTVAETVGKVARSLPDLEKYQVLMFSNRLLWPLGKPGEWIDFDREKSVERIRDAVKNTPPAGDTNMYDAFDTAFRFRTQGLDTIYLFSDGLPNSGPGLSPAEERANLKEQDRSEILARHIRAMMRGTWNRPDANKAKVRINSVGFFYESPDIGAFLWSLSRENDGSFVGMSKP